ncbi:Uncharacterised protein [Enterobacter cloacae]|nr:Uncharacterised protein [Enterobacter cloacae]
MNIHAGAQHDFTCDIGRFRHLHHLAENQLLNNLWRDLAASQHLPHHHFSQIDSRYTVKRGCLTRKRRT